MHRNRFRLQFLPNDSLPATPATDGAGSGGGAASQPLASAHPDGQQPNDRGFPENTPLAEMTDAQRANYYKFQNRQTDNKLSAFNGVTPEQVAQMAAELEALRSEQLTADERAIKMATDKAAADARAAAEAELRPKLDKATIRSIAAQVLTGDQLSAFVETANPSAFYGESGDIDTEKVTTHLTALFGTAQSTPLVSQPRAWGQYSASTPAGSRPGEAGKAAAARRFGTTT